MEIRIGQLARLFGVHRNTVSNWIKSGKLGARPTIAKRYLIDESELRRFCIQEHLPEECFAALIEGTAPVPPLVQKETIPNPVIEREVRMSTQPIGSVLVVGGGIAGIQASLDLANSGYAVHLVERSAGIGGAMAQLDKTYPTNDCAM